MAMAHLFRAGHAHQRHSNVGIYCTSDTVFQSQLGQGHSLLLSMLCSFHANGFELFGRWVPVCWPLQSLTNAHQAHPQDFDETSVSTARSRQITYPGIVV